MRTLSLVHSINANSECTSTELFQQRSNTKYIGASVTWTERETRANAFEENDATSFWNTLDAQHRFNLGHFLNVQRDMRNHDPILFNHAAFQCLLYMRTTVY